MEAGCKGDCYQIILKGFEFIGEVKNDEIVVKTDKEEYQKLIHKKVEKAAIASYLTKHDDLKYTTFVLQLYFSCPCNMF